MYLKVEISTICWKATGILHNLYIVICLQYGTIFFVCDLYAVMFLGQIT